jgi:two-component system, NarL family, sensor histidine kinase BarA
MAYHSLKRVLSETSVEQKCRLLFGASLLLVIGSGFIVVDSIAENLVSRTIEQERINIRQRGSASAEMSMLKVHFLAWLSQEDKRNDEESQARRLLVEEFLQGLEDASYKVEILGLTENRKLGIRGPEAPWEEETLQQLVEQAREDVLRLAAGVESQPKDPSGNQRTRLPFNAFPFETEAAPPESGPSIGPSVDLRGADELDSGADRWPSDSVPSLVDELMVPLASGVTGNGATPKIFQEKLLPEQDEYHYFQPVLWEKRCIRCHPSNSRSSSLVTADGEPAIDHYEPLRVIKVILPYRESREATHYIRAVLSATGILVFFFGMGALYLIVRWTIITPLKHLRDVSDAISRGNTELRAEIQTNDEFEELGESFNRMLRHMTDSQNNLQKVNRDLDAKVDELAQLNMRLYEMNRVKSDFLANMSHELRTPLNSIIGFSEVLQGIDSLTDKQKRYAQNIQKSGRVLLEMINDILDLAKIDAGKMDVRASEFSIDSIVQAQCDMVRALTEEKNIDLTCTVESGLPPMYTDQSKVQQILTNLLSNAIKFTPDGGRIGVHACRDDEGRLQLTVVDTGVGIAEEDREIIFEKFRQSRNVVGKDGMTREYSGTGLGLSIVKELCKLLRGEIDFESELGKGSTFSVNLPWALDNLPAEFGSGSRGMSEFRSQRPEPTRA